MNEATGGALVTLEITMICCCWRVAPSLSVTYKITANVTDGGISVTGRTAGRPVTIAKVPLISHERAIGIR